MLYLCALLASTPTNAFQSGLIADARVLREAFVTLHPGLYRYNTPRQIEARFTDLELRLAKDETLGEAYVDISRLTAAVRCGHTYPNFFNQRKTVAAQLFGGKNRVPFHFRWLGGQMVVTEDLTATRKLPAGTTIMAIDGIPSGRILTELKRLVRADGGNDWKRLSILGVAGRSEYEEFDVYLPLVFPVRPGGFDLALLSPDGRRSLLRVEALTREDRRLDAERQKARLGQSGDRWAFRMAAPGVGLLTMPTFVMYDSDWDWKGYLAKTFARLKSEGARALVIDLRGNEGGSSVGDELLAYMVSRPTDFDGYPCYTRYQKAPASLRPYLDTWDRSFDDWSPWCKPLARVATGNADFYRMTRWDGEGQTTIDPKLDRFPGKVFVLVDGSNSSATFEFARSVQQSRLGTLVGEPTGGNLRGINGSAFYFLRLPNSGIEVDVPLGAQLPASPQPDRGLFPDVKVFPTVRDIARGRDTVLERALDLAAHAPGTPSAHTP